jgi:hypothetical protein
MLNTQLFFIHSFKNAMATCCLLVMGLFVTPILAQTTDVEIKQAYVRTPIPGNTVTSGYFTLINHSEKPLILVGASSDISPKIEIHEHTMTDGMMQMRQLAQVIVEAYGKVEFKPYGLHLMIFDVQPELKSNTTANIALQFKHHPTITVAFNIQAISQTMQHAGHQ